MSNIVYHLSHYHYWSPKSQELVREVITPKLTLEISATPKILPTTEEIEFEEAGQVTIRFDHVVAEGMIKTCVNVNMEFESITDFHAVADDVIISAAIKKQNELIESYNQLGKNIVPLVLIQLPNESESTSALDITKLNYVKEFLRDKFSMTLENESLAIWLSDNKVNLENIENIDNRVKVLVFKQAIALGWDCPRAHILVMFRDIQSLTFEIQTVGRIMRMPEAEHYPIDALNQGYVYTNLEKIQIAQDDDSQSYFNVYPAHRISKYQNINLPSVYLSRIEYGDLTLSFRKLLIQEANNYFGILESDIPISARKKADKELDLLPGELTQPIISEVVLQSVDNVEEVIGKIVHFTVPEDDIKCKYEYFAKICSHPYAPVRSHTKIQQGLYDWFDKYLGYSQESRLEIQRIIVCSSNNQKIFKEIIETAKEKFKDINKREKEAKQIRKDYLWDIPVFEYFNESYSEVISNNYSMDKCYLKSNRSRPEQQFELQINNSSLVDYWYKNGTSREIYFSIPYIHPNDGVLHSFYPDYLVFFVDGTIGIYDTKSGFTIDSDETKAKSDALHEYIQLEKNKGRKIKGGIVNSNQMGLFVYQAPVYSKNIRDANWKRFEY